MSGSWPRVALGSVAQVERSSVAPASIEDGTNYLGLEHIATGGELEGPQVVHQGELASQKFQFDAGHILYGKLRPYLGKITVTDFSGICSTDILPIRPGPEVDQRFLLHFLRQPREIKRVSSLSTGANLPRINAKTLESLQIPLPPIEEQRRIAAVLDAADALRAKRREALAKLDNLTRAIFVDMFGDLENRARAVEQLKDLLTRPLRNGVSPSKSGLHKGWVLTLSAITGSDFDDSAVKQSRFAKPHDPDKLVARGDFLICRGNGNLQLAGRGQFPSSTLLSGPPIAFPDTMIAARCDEDRVSEHFLQFVWSTDAIRSQIERRARTTNGTFKINQAALETIKIPLPPIEKQRAFDQVITGADRHRARIEASAGVLDNLFASLQQRAFRGEL